MPLLSRAARDSGRIIAHALGVGGQFDALFHDKFEQLREHYRSPILDFGAGTCFFSRRLQDAGLDVTAVDVIDRSRHPSVRLRVLREATLPFVAGAFGTSTAHFVLHHIEDQASAFAELVRVTRGTIVVTEDVTDRWTDTVATWIHTGTSPWSKAWRGFRSTTHWLEFFARFPVDLVEQRTIPRWRTPHYPVRRVVFVLSVRPTAAAVA